MQLKMLFPRISPRFPRELLQGHCGELKDGEKSKALKDIFRIDGQINASMCPKNRGEHK
jgi:hypothetical protein